MEKYPELLRKQLENYEGEGLDWRTIAREKVFSRLSENILMMNRLQGLMVHEIEHLAHMAWRNEWERFKEMERDPWSYHKLKALPKNVNMFH